MTTTWEPEERTARMLFRFDDGSSYEQRVISQQLKPGDQEHGEFPLYYFVKDQSYGKVDPPTILFAAGGPGQINLPDTANFVDMHGYRTVYFHLRGTGFSQIPEDFEADKFLRTEYVLDDIEAIRKDLLDNKSWSAVIGHSYGALVAQAYAAHKPYGDYVEKVVLSAPMAPSVTVQNKNGEKQAFDNLRRIYGRKEFKFLRLNGLRIGRDIRSEIVNKVEKITRAVEERFGNVQYVVDNYDSLRKSHATDKLLDYGAPFFGAIRRLRHVGWLPLDVPYAKPIKSPKVDDTQIQCGLVIAKAMAKAIFGIELEDLLDDEVVKGKLDDGESLLGKRSTFNSDRAYWIFSVQDGLSARLSRNATAGSNVNSVLPSAGGTAGANPAIKKVSASLGSSKPSRPWNPADYHHDKPTLILKGGADPVTENGEAESYHDNKVCSGQRALVEFPGVGHSMALPDLEQHLENELEKDCEKTKLLELEIEIKDPKTGEIIIDPKTKKSTITRSFSTRDKLVDEFIREDSVEVFREKPIVKALARAFRKCLDEVEPGVVSNEEKKELRLRVDVA